MTCLLSPQVKKLVCIFEEEKHLEAFKAPSASTKYRITCPHLITFFEARILFLFMSRGGVKLCCISGQGLFFSTVCTCTLFTACFLFPEKSSSFSPLPPPLAELFSENGRFKRGIFEAGGYAPTYFANGKKESIARRCILLLHLVE